MEAAEECNNLVGDIIFPELIFKVSILAHQYSVPFGVAFNRLSDVGRIVWAKDHFEILPEETEIDGRA